jgi:hypothetical protein
MIQIMLFCNYVLHFFVVACVQQLSICI